IALYFSGGAMSHNSWILNKLDCCIMVIGSTPLVFGLVYDQLPLYKIWGGTSFLYFETLALQGLDIMKFITSILFNICFNFFINFVRFLLKGSCYNIQF